MLSIASDDAVSGNIAVSDVATLDLGGASVSVDTIAASGLVRNGSLTVTGAIESANAGSMLAVDGDLALAADSAVDFGGVVPTGWTPVAVASGTVSLPASLRARNAGDFTRCKTSVIDGVVYVRPTAGGFTLIIR